MKRRFILAAGVVLLFFLPGVRAQESKPDQPPQFHLLQLVDANTFLEKINQTAGEGYRLVAVSPAPAGSHAAILERLDDASQSYKYLSASISSGSKLPTIGKMKTETLERLNAEGAKGYRVCMILGPASGVALNLAVMELAPGPPKVYEYALVGPGTLLGYSQNEISRLTGSGYHWVAALAWLVGNALLFERAADSSESAASPQTQSAAGPQRRYKFLQNKMNGLDLPDNQLHKHAAEGARVIDFFGSQGRMLAMEEAVAPAAPFEYLVLKPKNLASPLALHVNMTRVEAEDLTRAGQQGYRLLRLTVDAPPYVMEKAPGGAAHYEYRLASSPRLPELAEQVNSAGQAGFHVARMESMGESLLVIMEKSDAPQP